MRDTSSSLSAVFCRWCLTSSWHFSPNMEKMCKCVRALLIITINAFRQNNQKEVKRVGCDNVYGLWYAKKTMRAVDIKKSSAVARCSQQRLFTSGGLAYYIRSHIIYIRMNFTCKNRETDINPHNTTNKELCQKTLQSFLIFTHFQCSVIRTKKISKF